MWGQGKGWIAKEATLRGHLNKILQSRQGNEQCQNGMEVRTGENWGKGSGKALNQEFQYVQDLAGSPVWLKSEWRGEWEERRLMRERGPDYIELGGPLPRLWLHLVNAEQCRDLSIRVTRSAIDFEKITGAAIFRTDSSGAAWKQGNWE